MNRTEYMQVKEALDFKPNRFKSGFILLLNFALLSAGFYLLSFESLSTYLLSQVILAFSFNHAYLILHETGHMSFFKSRKLNVVVGHIASVFAFLPFFARQHEHNGHHRWTGTFAEPSTKRALETFNSLNRVMFAFMGVAWRLWIPIFSFNEHLQIWALCFDLKDKVARKNFVSMLWLVAVYSAFALLVPGAGAIALKTLPAFALYFVIIEFFNLPHHVDSDIIASETAFPLWQHEVYSKGCKPVPFVNSFLFLNFNYHIGHHYFPNLPWHELTRAQARLENFDSKYSELESEWVWAWKLRTTPVEEVFAKYRNFQMTEQNKAA